MPEILFTVSSCHLLPCKYPFIFHVADSSKQSSVMPKIQVNAFLWVHVICLASNTMLYIIFSSCMPCFLEGRHCTYFIWCYKYSTRYSAYHIEIPQWIFLFIQKHLFDICYMSNIVLSTYVTSMTRIAAFMEFTF